MNFFARLCRRLCADLYSAKIREDRAPTEQEIRNWTWSLQSQDRFAYLMGFPGIYGEPEDRPADSKKSVEEYRAADEAATSGVISFLEAYVGKHGTEPNQTD